MGDNVDVEPKPASIRRNFTLRSNTARQVAVNFMPSRQLPHNTMRLRRNNSEHNALLEETTDLPDAVERQADIIVREMEQHQHLMEDNIEAEGRRREVLRDLPQGLTMKRNVRAKLSASVSLRSKRRPLSLYKRLKYRISFAFQRSRDRFRDFIFSIELWHEAIRKVEGHFGSAVGSYFYFLRWLFSLNLCLSILAVCFVVVPQVLHDERNYKSAHWGFMEFISGTGGWKDSLLFYGHYHDGHISTNGFLRYNMPFAYFFTVCCLYLVAFVLLCYRTAYSYRHNFIEISGGLSHVFANKVFCGWDFGIATEQAARRNANSIYNEFKELLYEQNKKQVKLSFCACAGRRVTNVAISGIVLALIAAVQWGFWLLLTLKTQVDHWEMYVSLIITVVTAVCPIMFHFIVKCEFYGARTGLFVTLARTWLLDIGTLTLLLVFWDRSEVDCWETSFGQEMYRLVLLDILISLFILPLIEICRGLIFKFCGRGSAPEFNIAYNSLTLIYNQALLWFGMLFSPLLLVIVTLKFLLLFYVKLECALRACQPARKVWRAAQTQTVLYVLVTLSLFAALLTSGSLFFSGGSHACGPFRPYQYVFSVLSEGVLNLSQHPRLYSVLRFITRPGFIAFVALFLCVAVYYMRAKAHAQRSMVELLRHMLVLQAKDKEFLLTAISKVSNGEWLYNPKEDDELGPDSHTWKFLKDVRRPSNANYNFDGSRLNQSMVEGRPKSYHSYAMDTRPNSYHVEKSNSNEDGDTDSSFSWQGSGNYINDRGATDERGGRKKLV